MRRDNVDEIFDLYIAQQIAQRIAQRKSRFIDL